MNVATEIVRLQTHLPAQNIFLYQCRNLMEIIRDAIKVDEWTVSRVTTVSLWHTAWHI